ncbi:hypothetical protein CDD81_3317 [Ophiocordyceps australis]|uniref:RNase III domain-containing protein n=1 Tax=Ophiocordyceps australis TaxID=1399860 RepID=A0A2C5YBU4_9HYPO|nr:hypothetical protein CDD81_3317 [Ophiocordyceps australis]
MFAITPWTSADISVELPPLPEVLDPAIEKIAFTRPGHGNGHEEHYERLEWLGDAYLELIASSLIFQTFQQTPSGRCSQIRELLIKNTTLASYFGMYGMDSRARLPVDFSKDRPLDRGRSSDKGPLKTKSDMFEAYVAAVIVSDPDNGLARAVSWLKALWARTIKDRILENERAAKRLAHVAIGTTSDTVAANSKLNSKDQIRAAIGAKGVQIRYEDIPGNNTDKQLGLPLYTVGVYLDGWGENNKLLGTGTALQKKEAGHKAAAMALANKKMIKVYVDKKKAFQEALKAADEVAASQS